MHNNNKISEAAALYHALYNNQAKQLEELFQIGLF